LKLEQDPSIWISFAISIAALIVVMRRG